MIPLRLDECAVPRRLRAWQYVDYFPLEQRKRAYQRLIQSLTARHAQLAASDRVEPEAPLPVGPVSVPVDLKDQVRPRGAETSKPVVLPAPAPTPSIAGLAGSILPILFFAQLAVVMFGQHDDIAWALLGTSAIAYAFFLIIKREIMSNRWLSWAMILFMLVHSLVIYGEYTGWSNADMFKILDGIVALIVVILLFSNFRSPRKSAPYASYVLAAYVALYGIKLLLNLAQLYPDWIQTPMTILAMIGSLFLWLER